MSGAVAQSQSSNNAAFGQLLQQLNQSSEQNAAGTAASIKTAGDMAQNGMASSNAASQMNEMMNQQAMVNNMRKAASELLKGAV